MAQICCLIRLIDSLLNLFWFSHRYPTDVYDRLWYILEPFEDWTNLSGSIPDDSLDKGDYQLRAIIMSTAVRPANDSAPLVIRWEPQDETDEFYVYMHFTEIQELTTNQTRQFNIMRNGELWISNFSPRYLAVDSLYTSSSSAVSGKEIKYSLVRTGNSTLPPIISALEIYRVIDLQKPQTLQGDGIFHFLNPIIWFSLLYMTLTTFNPSFALKKSWCDYKHQVSLWSEKRLARWSMRPYRLLVGWSQLYLWRRWVPKNHNSVSFVGQISIIAS